MVKEIKGKDKDSDKKKNKIYKLFICGSSQLDSNIKTGSKSSKNKSKSFWKRRFNSSKEEETKYLLEDNNYDSYTDIRLSKKGFKENAIKTKEQKVPKEGKEKEKKKKSLLKRVGKVALQTCRYISLGSVPGFAYNPSVYAYNYETRTYDYDYASYGYYYQSSQSYSPSIFF